MPPRQVQKCIRLCPVGHWIYTKRSATFHDSPLFMRLVDAHSRYHVETSRILRLLAEGRKHEALDSVRGGRHARAALKIKQLLIALESRERLMHPLAA